jgi:hypothetical protein
MITPKSRPALDFNVDLWRVRGLVPTRIHQRCVAIEEWERNHVDWSAWWRAYDHRHSLSIFWDWAPTTKAKASARLEVDPPLASGPGMVFLHVTDLVRTYEGLEPEAMTLTFLAGLNQLLSGIADRLDIPGPTPLPPTRRESRWLEEGNQAPAPVAVFTRPLTDRRKEVRPLPEADFWELVNELEGDSAQRERRLRGLLRKRTLPSSAARRRGGLSSCFLRAAASFILLLVLRAMATSSTGAHSPDATWRGLGGHVPGDWSSNRDNDFSEPAVHEVCSGGSLECPWSCRVPCER